jgi:hypothetical protein
VLSLITDINRSYVRVFFTTVTRLLNKISSAEVIRVILSRVIKLNAIIICRQREIDISFGQFDVLI